MAAASSPAPSTSARSLILGIGCRRGVSSAQVEAAVRLALGALSLTEVREVATLEDKTAEPGLRAFCDRHALPLRGIERARIAALTDVAMPGSAAAQRWLGLAGVSEPCALLASRGGRLLAGRIAHAGVTVAVAVDGPPIPEPQGTTS